jgi:hypothetical protein
MLGQVIVSVRSIIRSDMLWGDMRWSDMPWNKLLWSDLDGPFASKETLDDR